MQACVAHRTHQFTEPPYRVESVFQSLLSASPRTTSVLLSFLVILGIALPSAVDAQATVHFAGVQTLVGSVGASGSGPLQISIDPVGNLYVEAPDYGVIVKETPGANGTYTATTLSTPSQPLSGLGTDGSGNLYFTTSDSFSNIATVYKYTPSGSSYTSSIIPSSASPSEILKGIAVDAAGDVYILVSTGSSSRVLRETYASGTYTESVVLSGLPADEQNVAVDPAGNLYLADANTATKETYSAGTYTASTIATNVGSGNGISVDVLGNVYIAVNTGTVVYKETPNGNSYTQTVAVGGINTPGGVAIDSSGNLFVTEYGGDSVYKESVGAIPYGTQNVGATGAAVPVKFLFDTGGTIGAPTVVTQGTTGLDFAATTGTCISNGTSYTYSVGDTCTIKVTFTPRAAGLRTGAAILKDSSANPLATAYVYGTGLGAVLSFDAGLIQTLPLTLPGSGNHYVEGVSVDSNGSLYVVDQCTIGKYAVLSGAPTVVVGSGSCSNANVSGVPGPATSAHLRGPFRLVVNGGGDIFLSDSSSHVILKVDALTGQASVYAGTIGSRGHSADGVLAAGAQLNQPDGLALDGAGNLYFADSQNNVVREINALTGILSTVAGNYASGAGYSGDGGAATSAQLNNPLALAIGSDGALYIADNYNNVIRRVDSTTGLITTVAGKSPNACSNTGDGGLATNAELCDPEGVAVDAAGNIYIADSSNNLVRKVAAATGIITTAAGVFNNGTGGYTGDGGPATAASLSYFEDVTLDGSGNLYIADSTNHVVRKVSGASGIATFGSVSSGSSSSPIDVAVTNNGNTALNLSAVTPSTNFNVSGANTSCSSSTSLAPGAGCILGIRFMPTAGGSLTGTVTLTDNVNNVTGSTQSVAASGTGTALPATQLAISGVASTIFAGGNPGTVTVTLEDVNGNTASGSTSSVTLTLTGPGSYSQAVTVPAVGGIATFNLSSLTLTTGGTYTLLTTSTGLTSASANTVVVAATQTALTGVPSMIFAGGNLGTVTATIEYANGNTAMNSTASVTLTLTGPGGYSQAVTVSAVGGIATFDLSSFSLTAPGGYTATATSTGLTSSFATTSVILPPTQTALSGVPASLFTGGNLGMVTVSLDNVNGQVVTVANNSVVLTVTGPSGYSQVGTVNATNGVATFNLSSFSLTTVGTYTATATSAGLTSSMATTAVNPFASTITLNLSSVSAVEGAPVVLTATAAANGAPATPGQISFKYQQTVNGTTITGTFGKGSLTSAGTSILTVRPGPGVYALTAAFAGTRTVSPSVSASQTLTISGGQQYTTTTGIVSSGAPGSYTLIATVGQAGMLTTPTGSVSFLNTTSSNQSIATAPLDPATISPSLTPASNSPLTSAAAGIITTSDLNGDGIADLITLQNGATPTMQVQLGLGSGLFAPPTTYTVGSGTPLTRAVVADVNNDGYPDLILASQYQYRVFILLGDGTGAFTVPNSGPQILGVASPADLAVADLNHDGNLDLITADPTSGAVHIFLGNGDGTFQTAISSPTSGAYPAGITVADFNQDGIPDLAVSAIYSVNILLGNGDGTFQTPGTLPNAFPGAPLSGSLRSNGIIDLVVPAGNQLQVYLGNNDGTFASPVVYTPAFSPVQTMLADVNHDGRLDVVSLAAGSNGTGQIELIPGLGDGTFGAEQDFTGGGAGPSSFSISDLKNSGQTDFLLADSQDGTITILLGGQTVTATATGISVPGPNAQDVEASYTGDSLYAPSISSTVSLLPPTSATVLSVTSTAINASQPVTLTATIGSALPVSISSGTVDFYDTSTLLGTSNVTNGTASLTTSSLPPGVNGLSAIFSGSASFGPSTSNVVSVFNRPASAITLTLSTATVPAGNAVTLTASASAGGSPVTPGQVTFNYQQILNGTTLTGNFGRGSLTAAGTSTLTLRPAAGIYTVTATFAGTTLATGSTSAPQTLTIVGPAQIPTITGIASTGIPGNYTLTATVGQTGLVGIPAGTVSFLNTTQGNQSLATATIDPSTVAGKLISATGAPIADTNSAFVTTGDLNGDGIADLVSFQSGATNLQVQLGQGNGVFGPATTFALPFGSQLTGVIIADVNNDGKPDLIAYAQYAYAVLTMIGDGTGNFTVPSPGPQIVSVENPAYVLVADVDHDGNLDLLTADPASGAVLVLRGAGDGSFQQVGAYGAGGSYPVALSLGDLNSDGIQDVVVTNAGATIGILLGNADGSFQSVISTPYSSATLVNVGSLRGNGVMDLVVPDGFSYHVYLGNNDGTFAPPVTYPTNHPLGQTELIDVNLDGRLDFVTYAAGDDSTGQIDIFHGLGDGTFSAEQDLTGGGIGTSSFSIADVNNDGSPDFVLANTIDGTISVLIGQEVVAATATAVSVPGPNAQDVEASYAGDSAHSPSVSSTIPLLPPASTTVLSATPGMTVFGTPVTLTATVGSTPSLSPGSGTATFFSGSTQLAIVNLSGATATYTASNLPVGTSSFYAVFSGSTILAPSTSNTLNVQVASPSATSLSVSASTAANGTPVVLTATVAAVPAGTPLTAGQITFTYQQVVGGVTLTGTFGVAQLTSAGSAAITVQPGVGAYAITAGFNGINAATPSTSAPQTLNVTGTAGYATATTILPSGTPGNYTLTAQVGVFGMVPATGTVAFVDTTTGSTTLATAPLNPTPNGYALVAPNPPLPNSQVGTVYSADLNGDGIFDLVTLTSGSPAMVSVQLGNGDGTFQAATSYNVSGSTLNHMAIADVNNDGRPDLIVASSDTRGPGRSRDRVLVYLNLGGGLFSNASGARIVASPYTPSFVATGDFNRDGNIDIAVTDQADSTVGIILGNGDGTFQPQVKYNLTGVSPYGVVLGDYTGDGITDLAVTTLGSTPGTAPTIEIKAGKGDGTFTAANTFNPPGYAFPGTTVSLRNNGILDLIVPDGYDPDIYVYLGNGDGTFASPITVSTTYNIQNVILTDFDHDGKLDIVGSSSANSGPGQVSVFLGNGDGTFGAEQDFPVGASPNNIAMGDFNHDGLMDYVSSDTADNTSTVLLGARFVTANATGVSVPGPGPQQVLATYSGDSAHTPSTSPTTTLLPVATATALSATPLSAVPGSLITMVATVSSTLPGVLNTGTVTFFQGTTALGTANVVNGTATFSIASLAPGYTSVVARYSGTSQFGISTSQTILLFVGNSLSSLSLAVSSTSVNSGTPLTLTATAARIPGSAPVTPGQVTFNFVQTLNGASISGSLGTAQLNASGIAALTVQPGPGAYVVTANFAGTANAGPSFSAPQTITVNSTTGYATTTALTAAGMPGDYLLTAAVSGFGPSATGAISFSNTTSGNQTIATAPLDPATTNSNPVPSTASPIAIPTANWAETGDFNGDGIPDLVTVTDSQAIVQLGNGDGTFQTAVTTTIPTAFQVAVGDLDGDGKADLAVVLKGNSQIRILLGAGDGTFVLQDFALQVGSNYPSAAPDYLALADLNHDGKLDIVTANSNSNEVSVFLGVGDGTFPTQQEFAAGQYPVSVAIADYNGDGIPDLAVSNGNGGDLSLLFGDGTGNFSAATSMPLPGGAYPGIIATGSLRNNGINDIVVPDEGQAFVYVYLGNNDGTFPAQPIRLSNSFFAVSQVALSDYNHDGKLDIVANAYIQLSLYRGNGDGTFNFQTDVPLVNSPSDGYANNVTVADLNHDGLPDFITSNLLQAGNNDTVLLNQLTTTAAANHVFVSGTGTQNVTASFAGDDIHASSLSPAVPLQPSVQAPSTTVLTSSAATIVSGATITITATIAPVPTSATFGTVTFTSNGSLLATANVAANGVAVHTTSTLPAGIDAITAVYSGDAGLATSTSTPLPVAVVTSTTTALTTSSSSGPYDQPPTLTAAVAPAPSGTPLGTVSFFSSSTLLGTAIPNGSGIATLTSPFATLGANSITAVYSGNALYSTSASPASLYTLTQASTSTVLTVANPTPTNGQPVVLTATVSPASTDTPAGTVTFFSGTISLGTTALTAGGTAALSLPTLPSGINLLTAVYSGSVDFTGSTSAGASLSGSQPSTTAVASSTLTPAYGQSFVLTATVNPTPAGTSGGTVSFYSATTLLGAAPVTASGVATLTVNTINLGANGITAVYSGNIALNPSTSPVLSINVVPNATSTTVAASTLAPAYGQILVLTATVTPTSTDTPRGTVNFYSGSTLLGASPLTATGTATLSVGTLTAGTSSITAAYSGSAVFSASTSNALSVNVVAAATVTSLASSTVSPGFGQSVTLTATVTPPSTDATRGTIRFFSGTILLGASPLTTAGVATLSTTALSLGSNTVQASYTGSASFAGSTSPSLTVTARAATAVTFTANPTTQLYNNPITFTAQVVSATPGTPGGVVSFLDNGTLVGTSTLTDTGKAVLTTIALPSGDHTLTAVYSGDGSFLASASTGTPIAITVADLNLALGGDNNKTVSPGDAVTYNFPLSPLVTPTFIYNVTLTATGLPPGATYTFTPAVIPAGSGTLPVAFKVQTAANTAALPAGSTAVGRAGQWSALALGLLLPFAGTRRVRARLRAMPRSLAILLFGILSLGLATAVSGCGGGGFFGSSLVGKSYTITVHATSADLERTSTVQLNFQ